MEAIHFPFQIGMYRSVSLFSLAVAGDETHSLIFFVVLYRYCLLVFSTGMLAPMLVQMERQIDREIAADNKANGGTQTDDDSKQTISTSTENGLFDTDSDDEDADEPMLMYGPQPQIITNDLKSLDEMVSTNKQTYSIHLHFKFNVKERLQAN